MNDELITHDDEAESSGAAIAYGCLVLFFAAGTIALVVLFRIVFGG
jgi:hypothetical protein